IFMLNNPCIGSVKLPGVLFKIFIEVPQFYPALTIHISPYIRNTETTFLISKFIPYVLNLDSIDKYLFDALFFIVFLHVLSRIYNAQSLGNANFSSSQTLSRCMIHGLPHTFDQCLQFFVVLAHRFRNPFEKRVTIRIKREYQKL